MAKTKQCNYCGEPLTKLLLGTQRFPVWAHRGDALKTCRALKLKQNVMQEYVQIIMDLGKKRKVEIERKPDGEVMIFGERRATATD